MLDAAFEYYEDARGLPITVVTSPEATRLDLKPMSQLEPILYGALTDQLPDRAVGAMLGTHDGGVACLACGAAANRGKRLRLHCLDAVHAAFETNAAAWKADATKDPETEGRSGGLDLCIVDATRMSPDHVPVAVERFGAKLAPGGWMVVRGGQGPLRAATAASLETAGFKALMLEPPYGFHVSVAHRDPAALDRLGGALRELYAGL
jgi:hypothetical protein